MGRNQMAQKIHKVIVAALLSLCCAAAAAQSKDIAPERDSDLNEPTLYDFLLGEIALQRGDLPLAAKTYLDLAKRTRDARVARRAVEVASQARLPEVALEAARLWNSIEPGSAHSLQVLAAMLVAAKRVDEAGPVLEKLLAAEGVNRENGFMQLNRLLSGNADKPSNLRVIRGLAAKHPDLPQAHFAVAQAAALAEDDAAAIAAPAPPRAARSSCGRTGSSRRPSRRSCCRSARPGRRRGASGSSSRRIRARATRASATRAFSFSTSVSPKRASSLKRSRRRTRRIPT
jgi:hypothetical protein